MAGLQRSAVSFRRQGSSGFVWDHKLLSGELNLLTSPKEDAINDKAQQQDQRTIQEVRPSSRTVVSVERSRSNAGRRGFRTGKVSPAIEPPSPKVSACGFCSAFGKHDETRRRPKFSKRRT